MNPARKRKIRLVVALGVAIALATALIYTSFSASTEASKPSQLQEGRSYEVTGKVVKGSIRPEGPRTPVGTVDVHSSRRDEGHHVTWMRLRVTDCPRQQREGSHRQILCRNK